MDHFYDVLDWALMSGLLLEDFLKRYARRLDPKYWNRVVSESSNATVKNGDFRFYAGKPKGERSKGNKGAKVKKK